MTWNSFIETAPTRREIFECLFKLNESEINVLEYMLTDPGKSCESVGKALGKSRSVVQRAMSRLMECNLVVRTQVTKEGRSHTGYMYVYKPIKDLKSYLLQTINESRSRMEELVKKEFQ
ncbi:MAG: helix-turn-helix domain-containing protein [Candidatus Hodarchaeota archaeon]